MKTEAHKEALVVLRARDDWRDYFEERALSSLKLDGLWRGVYSKGRTEHNTDDLAALVEQFNQDGPYRTTPSIAYDLLHACREQFAGKMYGIDESSDLVAELEEACDRLLDIAKQIESVEAQMLAGLS